MSSIRLGTASPSTQSSTPATISLLSRLAHAASAKNIDILLLPEAFIGGYPRGTAFGCVIGDRSADGRDEFARYFDGAVDLGDTVGDGGAGAGERWVGRKLAGGAATGGADGSVVVRGDGTREELERIAKETGVFIVVGCIEKAGGSLYCAVVYVCPKEGIIGKRRKVMPTGTERLIWAQGCPSTLKAVSTTIRDVRVNLAAAICWESYMPLLRQSLYAQNVNLYLAPTADGRDAWLGLMRTVGVEGRCFVVSSNMCVRGEGQDKDVGGGGGLVGEEESGVERGGSRMDGVVHGVEDGRGHRPVELTSADSIPEEEGLGEDDSMSKPVSPPRGRRNSTFTEEGFEIALPRSAPTSPSQLKRRRRRKSVIDENGNEIVLCCDDDNGTTAGSKSKGDMRPPSSPTKVNGRATSSTANKGGQTRTFLSRGGSCIVNPFGDVLAGPQWEDDEGLIYADVDFRDCIRGRLDLDAAGSYSRNDAFKLTVRGLDMEPLPY